MRVRLESLPAPLHAALVERLSAAGHEAPADDADALVVGTGDTPAPRNFLRLTQDDWEAGVARTMTAFCTVRDFAARLAGAGQSGRIVVVIDPRALRATDGAVEAAVSGAFLRAVVQVGAAELGTVGIGMNVLAAGWSDPAPAALADGTPLGRLARAEEIADACEFLISSKASFVTGATLVADGGWTITKAGGTNPLMDDDERG